MDSIEYSQVSPTDIVESIGMIKILDESLQEIQVLLDKMELLARQSASDLEGGDCRREELQKEIENLKAQIDTIAKRIDYDG